MTSKQLRKSDRYNT